MLDASCQTTGKTGTQPHPLAVRLPKVILSSQTPQNTPPGAALPIRGTRYSPTHQNTGTSRPHQEAYTSHWTNLTHWGQTPKTMGTTNLQPKKRRPQTQYVKKMRRQRNTQQMKEQGKNPPDETNEEEIGSQPAKEFKGMILKMIQKLGNRMEKIQETFKRT